MRSCDQRDPCHRCERIILIGTPTWSQDVDVAAKNPITGYQNLMYTFHFYAATHKDTYRKKLEAAVRAGLPVFVSEYGVCEPPAMEASIRRKPTNGSRC